MSNLFVRKATGMVRSWSVFDAFIYALFSINLITLGLYSFSQIYYFEGGMVNALIISAIFIFFEVVVYAALIAVMPRSGGDYVWQSRILGGAVGFILAVTGWWFILWLWVPLYGDMFRHIVLVPILGIALLICAFLVNLSANRLIQGLASLMGAIKIGGIVVFGLVGVAVAADKTDMVSFNSHTDSSLLGFIGATALGILAFKGFTTITNSGSELKNPHRNVGRSIVISILLCILIYALVGFAVSSNLSLEEIVATRNYSLAAAARPAMGDYGLWFTVILAMVATAGGILASVFAVSRMLAMLTEMKLVPHSHFGMPGSIQKHTLVYTIVLGLLLTAFFDLSRIAALGIIFYLVMDIAIHWGVLRHLYSDLDAKRGVVAVAIVLDLVVLTGFVLVKISSDLLVIGVACLGMLAILLGEALFLRKICGTIPFYVP